MSAMKRKHRTEPLAVLISDIHFSLNTLELASIALKDALGTAEKLKVPLILCGDTNDTKAIIRAEVANAIIKILKHAKTTVQILVGNHDLINEKAKEHGLNYLTPYATIIDSPTTIGQISFIPYQSTTESFLYALQELRPTGILIIHQGVNGAFMGDYIQDKSAIDSSFEGLKVFSGHYHRHQTVGDVTYVGNPYSLSYGEANDGPKGYLIINADGSYKQKQLQLRRHRVLEHSAIQIIQGIQEGSHPPIYPEIPPHSLIKLKITGVMKHHLKFLTKEAVGKTMFGNTNFIMELIEEKDETNVATKDYSGKEGNTQLFDTLINELNIHDETKQELKSLWRNLL